MRRLAKLLADLLTLSRLPLALAIIWIGLQRGWEGFVSSIWLTLAAWTSDLVDGRIARWSHAPKSWIGERDLHVDMILASSLFLYGMTVGQIEVWQGALFALVWAVIFIREGITRPLGSLYQAIIYGGYIWVALTHSPQDARWLIGWILLALALTWKRFSQELAPDFVAGMAKFFRRGSHLR